MSHNIVICPVPLPRCHADCFPPSPGGRRLPAAWQSARQLAGIRHASPVLPTTWEIGVADPDPHPPRMLAPSIPRGLRGTKKPG